jgi:Zn-dependent oligopeptidase
MKMQLKMPLMDLKSHHKNVINDDKTKYTETTCKPNKEKYMRINNSDIERVNQFKHLVSIITNNNNISSEISHRINMGIHVIMY